MYTSINGLFENGHLTLLENPPTTRKTKVVITFMEEFEMKKEQKKRRLGGLEGKIDIPADFNEPLSDLNDYMF